MLSGPAGALSSWAQVGLPDVGMSGICLQFVSFLWKLSAGLWATQKPVQRGPFLLSGDSICSWLLPQLSL